MSFKERYLRGDCSIDMVNDYVEMWHGEGEIKKTLSEFLGLSQEEYVCWMISSDEELARMLSRSLPNRDLPYCARHIGWKELKEQLGDDQVILGLSGGVDSSVAAVLLNRAIGRNLTCIFVDHGMLRKNEFANVMKDYECLGLNVRGVDASQKFLGELAGVTDPEQKRKIIGAEFVRTFEEESNKLPDVKYLAQGTIYPDVIESGGNKAATIKSHHNVGGLPDYVDFKEIIEPLRLLFKDEVRRVGRSMGISEQLIGRHPFPGPGLAIRILGDITPEKVEILQNVDKIYIDSLRAAGLYDQVWQAGAVLLPVKSVGVMGDERTYESCVALRAVTSTDGMTADWVHLPYEFLANVSNDIINKVKGVNRVVYDISSKPPATIEWE